MNLQICLVQVHYSSFWPLLSPFPHGLSTHIHIRCISIHMFIKLTIVHYWPDLLLIWPLTVSGLKEVQVRSPGTESTNRSEFKPATPAHSRYQFGQHSLHNTLINSLQQLARGPSFSPMWQHGLHTRVCVQPVSARAVHLTPSICTVTTGSAPFRWGLGKRLALKTCPLVRFLDNFMQCDPVACTD